MTPMPFSDAAAAVRATLAGLPAGQTEFLRQRQAAITAAAERRRAALPADARMSQADLLAEARVEVDRTLGRLDDRFKAEAHAAQATLRQQLTTMQAAHEAERRARRRTRLGPVVVDPTSPLAGYNRDLAGLGQQLAVLNARLRFQAEPPEALLEALDGAAPTDAVVIEELLDRALSRWPEASIPAGADSATALRVMADDAARRTALQARYAAITDARVSAADHATEAAQAATVADLAAAARAAELALGVQAERGIPMFAAPAGAPDRELVA